MKFQSILVCSALGLVLGLCSFGCGAKDEDPQIKVLTGKDATDARSKLHKPMGMGGGAPSAAPSSAAASD